MTTWKEKSAEFFTFDMEHQSIEGLLTNVEKVMIGENEVNRYTIQAGEQLRSFLGGVQLDSLLADVELNTLIHVQYEGQTTSKSGRPVNQYRVWVKEGE